MDARRKFRIRIYNGDASHMNLEIKEKLHGYTKKTGCPLTLEQADRILAGLPPRIEAGTPAPLNLLAMEMQLHRLRPVVIVDYERTAYVGKLGNVRITLDQNIAGSADVGQFFDPRPALHPILPPGQHVPEVCIFFNGKLIRGNRAIKINAEGFHAFDSFNYPHLCDVGINFQYHKHHILTPHYDKPMVPHLRLDPNVIVFSLFPGIQDNIVRHVLESPDLRGIVMRTFGSGNAPHAPWIIRLLGEAAHRGVNIVNISQCLTGSVEMERYGAGFQLKTAHVISGHDSTVEAMVTKMMYLQGRFDDNRKVREMLKKSLAGEITV